MYIHGVHLCRQHTHDTVLFFLVQPQLLARLNNSVQVRISISYSILNMPKRATDKGQEARLQLGLLLQTIGRQIHFVTMPAVLWAINFVPGSFLHPPSCDFFCFVCVCRQPWVFCYPGSSDSGASKRAGYSSGSLRYCRLIGWGVSQANRPQTLMWHAGERETERGKT